MATYTPITDFTFDIGDYTPDRIFDFETGTVLVSDFTFDIGDYTPDRIFDFETGTVLVSDFTSTLDDLVGNFETGTVLVSDFTSTLDDLVGSIVAELNPSAIINGTLRGVIPDMEAQNYFNQSPLGIVAVLDGISANIESNYDPNVNRYFQRNRVEAIIEETDKRYDTKLCGVLSQAEFKSNKDCSIQENGEKTISKLTGINQNSTIVNPDKICSVVETGEMIYGNTQFVTEQGTFTDGKWCSIIQEGTWIPDDVLHSVAEQMTKVYPPKWGSIIQDSSIQFFDSLKLAYYDPDPPYNYTPVYRGQTFNVIVSPDAESLTFNFNIGNQFYFRQQLSYGVVTNTTCGSWGIATYFEKPKCSIVEETRQPQPGTSPWIDLPIDPVDPDPPSGTSWVVPIQETYIMENTILVTLDDDLTEIHLDTISLTLDADSYAWSFSANLLDPDQKPLVLQNSDGTAKIIHVTINGYTWHLLVEKIATTKRFGEMSISINGRGLTALLAKPYNQLQSVNFESVLTNQQIIDQMLPVGWTETFESPTWLVSAGAYGYQNKTTADALKDITEMMGSCVVPSRDSQHITIRSRYPVSPWNFDATIADIIITDDSIIELTEEPSARYNGNGVYVHGTDVGGQLGFVRLSSNIDPSDGSGSRLAPTVSNALMTDANTGIRHLGERILSGQYEQPAIKSFTTFMDGTLVPLIEIGNLISATIGGVEIKGICNSIYIQASHAEVSQQITIGDSTTNNWVAFNELLPKNPLLIGTLNSTDGITSLMTMIDGGVIRVRGTGNVNAKYYIRYGEIVSDAPDLPTSTIVLG